MRIRLLASPTIILTALALALGFAACGGDQGDDGAVSQATEQPTEQPTTDSPASSEAVTEVIGGQTELRLSQGLEAALSVVGADIEPIAPAHTADGAIALPISGGTLDLDTLSGRIEHDGGIRFSAAGRSVEATALVLELERDVVTAEIGGHRVPFLGVDFPNPGGPPQQPTVVFARTPVTLSGEAVSLLNQQLGIDALDSSLKLGTLSVEAKRP